MALLALAALMSIMGSGMAESVSLEPDAEFRNIDRLRTDLRRDYQVTSRPVKHHDTTVHVNVAFIDVKLTGVDTTLGSLTLSGIIFMSWTDEHLRWDQSMYGGIHEVVFSNYEVWTPDILSYNSVTSEAAVRSEMDRCNIVVMPNGTVYWTPSFRATISCNLDMSDYPSDIQFCSAVFGMWVSRINEVKLDAGMPRFKTIEWLVTSHVLQTTEWTFLHHSLREFNATELDGSTYSSIAMDVTIQRSSDMLHFLIRVPYYLAALTQVAIFFLTAVPSVERISLTMFALLLLYAESLMVNNVLLPGFPGLRVPSIIKSLQLNALEIAFNLIISQAAYKFLINMKIANIVEDRVNLLVGLISNYRLLLFLCCNLFYINLESDGGDNECVSRPNSLTSGIHDLAEGLVEPETEADDVAIAGRLSSPTSIDKKTGRTLVLLIDRCLLLQYLIFLMIFHA